MLFELLLRLSACQAQAATLCCVRGVRPSEAVEMQERFTAAANNCSR
jgi:hypothetical protein